MRCVVWIATLALAGCGGGQKPAAASGSDDKASSDPGMRCLVEAETPRKAPTDAPERIDLAQIVVRHAAVKDAGDVIRTREEACLRALEVRKKLLAGGDWEAVYAEYSDSQGATQGALYDVTEGTLDQDFAAAAFSLRPDELSYPVETKRGFHIIWRKK